MAASSFLFVGVLLCIFGYANADCPTVGVQRNFNLTEYTARRWYIQKQMEVQYLPLSENYCVYAEYNITSPQHVSVKNYANVDMVNGKVKGGNLCAVVADADMPAKLKVGPCFLPSLFYGPYWVVAAGPKSDNYEWAIVSGGQPTHDTGKGCTTGSGVNNSGFWYFTRAPVANSSLISMLERIAVSKGFDTSVLNDVEQKGCKYQDAEPKTVFSSIMRGVNALN